MLSWLWIIANEIFEVVIMCIHKITIYKIYKEFKYTELADLEVFED
jgi:hypothetical protein